MGVDRRFRLGCRRDVVAAGEDDGGSDEERTSEAHGTAPEVKVALSVSEDARAVLYDWRGL
jgi:hypothetical protein